MKLSALLHAWLPHQCKVAHVEKSTDRGDLQGDFWFITLSYKSYMSRCQKFFTNTSLCSPSSLCSHSISSYSLYLITFQLILLILPFFFSSLSPFFSPIFHHAILPHCCLIRKSDPNILHNVTLKHTSSLHRNKIVYTLCITQDFGSAVCWISAYRLEYLHLAL